MAKKLIASNQITISVIADGTNGKDAYTVVLSNESQTISTDTGLKPLTATTYSCVVSVYRGTTKLTATNSTPSTNQFKVTLPSNPTGITLGQSTAGTITFATTTSTAISANGNINLSIQINGVSETITKTISYSASKQGNTGSTGAAGSSATSYWLISSASAIGKNTSNVFNPASVTFTLKSQTGTNAVTNYNGRIIIAESTDGSTFTDKYTSSSNESAKSHSPSSTNVKSIRVRMYQAGGTSVLLDEQLIPIVTDGSNGAPAVTAVLSNDSHTIPCNTSGTPTTYAGAVTTMSVFVGASDTSSSWTYSISATNVTGNASNNNRTYTVTGISADTGYVDITASRSGYSNVTKRFSLAKAKQGNTGATGPQGPTGATGPQGPQGEALDIYDGTFSENTKFWSTKYDSYTKPGSNVVAKSANTSKFGGKTLKITNDTWLYSKNPIAIEEGRIYKFTYRVRQLQNPTNDATKNKIYGGATEFSHSGAKLSTNNGTYFITSGTSLPIKWNSINGDTAPNTYDSAKDDQYMWTEFVTYKSTSAKSAITYGGVTKFPAVSAFTSGTKYIKPMFIVNYSGGNGITEVDGLIVKDVTAEYEAAKESANKLNNNAQEIWDKVTDEGKKQGLFTDNSGKIYINGEYINARNLRVQDNNNNLTFGVDSSGNVTIKPTTFSLTPSTANQTTMVNLLNNNTNSTSTSNGIYLSNNKIYVNASNIVTGTLDASKANITNLNASNIKTGTLTGDRLHADAINGKTIVGATIKNAATNPTFQVTPDGALTCSNATITGGSFNIGNKFKVDTAGNLTTTGSVSASNLNITGGSINIGNKFKVDTAGNLTAQNAEITGNIKGSSIYGSTFSSYYETGVGTEDFDSTKVVIDKGAITSMNGDGNPLDFVGSMTEISKGMVEVRLRSAMTTTEVCQIKSHAIQMRGMGGNSFQANLYPWDNTRNYNIILGGTSVVEDHMEFDRNTSIIFNLSDAAGGAVGYSNDDKMSARNFTIFKGGQSGITGGPDAADSDNANLKLHSWYGIGFAPTIEGQTVPKGENATWMNVRTGDVNTRGRFYSGWDKMVYHHGDNAVYYTVNTTSSDGSGNNVKLGDDCYIGDCNQENTFRVSGNQTWSHG